jgi:hypothetical protein
MKPGRIIQVCLVIALDRLVNADDDPRGPKVPSGD